MFQLYDSSRRRICLAGFVLFGLVPMATSVVWCVSRHLPQHLAAEKARLQRQFGLDVTLPGLTHVRPGVVRYERLELADPETGKPLFGCQELLAESTTQTDARGRRRPTLVLTAVRPEVRTEGIERLAELLHRALRREAGYPAGDVRLVADEVAIGTGQDAWTLRELRASLEQLADGAQAQVAFRLPESEAREPVRLRIARNRETNPPRSGVELNTGGSEVPCSVLAVGLPAMRAFGSRSRFRGYLWANQTHDAQAAEHWNAEVTGYLLDLDLERLITERFAHRLSGTGHVEIQQARFRNGRLESASGRLLAGPGVVSRSLLRAAAEHLRLVEGRAVFASTDLIEYDQLALSLLIDADGLTLRGQCGQGRPGTLLTARGEALLGESPAQPQPVAALLRALVPRGDVQVPATRQTEWLSRHLPLPSARGDGTMRR